MEVDKDKSRFGLWAFSLRVLPIFSHGFWFRNFTTHHGKLTGNHRMCRLDPDEDDILNHLDTCIKVLSLGFGISRLVCNDFRIPVWRSLINIRKSCAMYFTTLSRRDRAFEASIPCACTLSLCHVCPTVAALTILGFSFLSIVTTSVLATTKGYTASNHARWPVFQDITMRSSPLKFALLPLVCLQAAVASPAPRHDRRASSTSVKLDGVTYVNKGLVAFGLIPSNFIESTGDTLGGIGSAITFKDGTWQRVNDTYTGTLVVQPDRGYNVEGTIDYQARVHEIDFVLTPYTGTKNLDFDDAQKTLQLVYQNTVLRFERNGVKTSGLDPTAVRAAQSGAGTNPDADPQMPIASKSEAHLTIDAEGIASNGDGTYWVSDEYGPYIYRFSADGQLIQTIQPPAAFLPMDKNGNLEFTSEDDPHTGRAGNQGFEGLTIDPVNKVLYAMLQSAAIQDGGDDKGTARYTRMVAYDVSDLSVQPELVGEWVVPLPLSDKDNAQPCSEILYVRPNIFLALSRDGDGRAGDDNHSKYRQADLFSIAKATDIHGSKYDDPKNPIADDGDLNKDITPANYVSFVNMINDDQLEKFGLHNDDPSDETLVDAKWESLAFASAEDPDFPDDYFLFTASDNDFISTHGVSLGKPFNGGLDVDNQFMVFRVTLPGVPKA